MTTTSDNGAERQQAGSLPGCRVPASVARPEILQSGFGVFRRRLIDLIDRATRRRVTLICAPAGTGKTAACSEWAAARAGIRPVVWLTIEPGDNQAWLWPRLCSGLKQAAVAPPDVLRALEDGPASAFALRLVEVARQFAEPVVIVLDKVDNATDETVLKGLDLLALYAPPSLRLVMCGQQRPGLHLARLRASGELAEISVAELWRVTANTR
jgi:LuxR family transcriptional regulator, maltose regulon positive regulatory protein